MNFLLLQVAHVAHPSRSEASSPLWEGMRCFGCGAVRWRYLFGVGGTGLDPCRLFYRPIGSLSAYPCRHGLALVTPPARRVSRRKSRLPPTMMTSTQASLLLREAGIILYGENWRPEMARRRNISPMAVRRWANATGPIPDQVWVELRDELRSRKLVIEGLLERLPG